MERWYGKLLGVVAGALLFRVNPLAGAVVGLLVGHAFDVDWFRTRGDDPYKVLGVERDASDADIEQAYRRLMSQFHPDKLGQVPEAERATAERRTREINRARDRIAALRNKKRRP